MSQLFSNSVKISYFNDKQRNLKNEKNRLCVLQFIVSATLLNLKFSRFFRFFFFCFFLFQAS